MVLLVKSVILEIAPVVEIHVALAKYASVELVVCIEDKHLVDVSL